jgi:hypothetical protein
MIVTRYSITVHLNGFPVSHGTSEVYAVLRDGGTLYSLRLAMRGTRKSAVFTRQIPGPYRQLKTGTRLFAKAIKALAEFQEKHPAPVAGDGGWS